MTLKRAASLLGIAGVVYAGSFVAFTRFHKNDAVVSVANAETCSLPSVSQNQNQIYFVGCGGFF